MASNNLINSNSSIVVLFMLFCIASELMCSIVIHVIFYNARTIILRQNSLQCFGICKHIMHHSDIYNNNFNYFVPIECPVVIISLFVLRFMFKINAWCIPYTAHCKLKSFTQTLEAHFDTWVCLWSMHENFVGLDAHERRRILWFSHILDGQLVLFTCQPNKWKCGEYAVYAGRRSLFLNIIHEMFIFPKILNNYAWRWCVQCALCIRLGYSQWILFVFRSMCNANSFILNHLPFRFDAYYIIMHKSFESLWAFQQKMI